MLESVGFWCDTIQRFWADSGYDVDLETWLRNQVECQQKIAVQPKGTDFQVLPKQ